MVLLLLAVFLWRYRQGSGVKVSPKPSGGQAGAGVVGVASGNKGFASSSGNKRPRGFASMRFGSDAVHKHEAVALKQALEAHGVDLFVAAPKTGENITDVVFKEIELADFFVALATSTYAEDTGNPACTNKELSYWQTTVQKEAKDKGVEKPLIPIRMLKDGEEFDISRPGVLHAKVLFGTNDAYFSWPLGSTRGPDGSTTLPKGLVRKILDTVGVSEDAPELQKKSTSGAKAETLTVDDVTDEVVDGGA